jgi:hypothetical protein
LRPKLETARHEVAVEMAPHQILEIASAHDPEA